jgi:hypothetical protein
MFPSRSSGGEARDDGRDRSPIPSGELPSELLESPAATSPGPAGWTPRDDLASPFRSQGLGSRPREELGKSLTVRPGKAHQSTRNR